jgi:hypothetical protein
VKRIEMSVMKERKRENNGMKMKMAAAWRRVVMAKIMAWHQLGVTIAASISKMAKISALKENNNGVISAASANGEMARRHNEGMKSKNNESGGGGSGSQQWRHRTAAAARASGIAWRAARVMAAWQPGSISGGNGGEINNGENRRQRRQRNHHGAGK